MFIIEQTLAQKVLLALFHLNQIATFEGLLVHFATGSLLGWTEQRIGMALVQAMIYTDVGLTSVFLHERWWFLAILVLEISVLISSWYLIA